MPIPTRFDRWMRSNDSAMTARTPWSSGPLAAQSRDEPEPYSLPASTTSGVPSRAVALGGVEDAHSLARRQVLGARSPRASGVSRLRSRMFANVPRIITS